MWAKERRTNRRRLRSFSSLNRGTSANRFTVLWSLHPFLFPHWFGHFPNPSTHLPTKANNKHACVRSAPSSPAMAFRMVGSMLIIWVDKITCQEESGLATVGSIEVDKSLPIHLSRRVGDYCQFGRDYMTYYPPGDVVFLRGILNLQWYWRKHEMTHHLDH